MESGAREHRYEQQKSCPDFGQAVSGLVAMITQYTNLLRGKKVKASIDLTSQESLVVNKILYWYGMANDITGLEQNR